MKENGGGRELNYGSIVRTFVNATMCSTQHNYIYIRKSDPGFQTRLCTQGSQISMEKCLISGLDRKCSRKTSFLKKKMFKRLSLKSFPQ
jgi:hypothetical protein